ncbi:MAG: ABC transporter ATP-binding protein [Candidatus Korarchaeota archaeon]|nr:ABC transporter ATP-binding protein [Candidatus Korarchaeota archaeon]NIU83638.1 ATP-binding cassette domain-containing protein [Candidatus Thorarchaeota archaeon]NIW13865.1 ATP-binding cassette domain-containing protein [Candidatus Thorarchaeota archaeon]NIW51976.1 ATP-binding cassette domain-containing protein [Candidatus Korarchaeota archaeon]
MLKQEDKTILEVKDLKKHFETAQGTVKAVDGINFDVKTGEMFGLVGESGSGKTTTGFAIAGARVYVPTAGKILYNGQDITIPARERPQNLKGDISMVFQDPASSLNPRETVKEIISRPLKVHGAYDNDADLREKVAHVLKEVRLPPEEFMRRTPGELGGGEAQLVAIARALALDPSFVIFDEPTSALDVSIQAKVLRVVLDAQKDYNLSGIFITHNLGVVRNITTRLGIMYLGRLYEKGPTQKIFENPLHPYTKMLLSSIPVLTEEEEKMKPAAIESIGEIPSPVNPPPGCSFHPRCPFSKDKCSKTTPEFVEAEKGHFVACNSF